MRRMSMLGIESGKELLTVSSGQGMSRQQVQRQGESSRERV